MGPRRGGCGGLRSPRCRTEPGPGGRGQVTPHSSSGAQPCAATRFPLWLPNPGCAGAYRFSNLITSFLKLRNLQWSNPPRHVYNSVSWRRGPLSSVRRRAVPVARGCALCPPAPRGEARAGGRTFATCQGSCEPLQLRPRRWTRP